MFLVKWSKMKAFSHFGKVSPRTMPVLDRTPFSLLSFWNKWTKHIANMCSETFPVEEACKLVDIFPEYQTLLTGWRTPFSLADNLIVAMLLFYLIFSPFLVQKIVAFIFLVIVEQSGEAVRFLMIIIFVWPNLIKLWCFDSYENWHLLEFLWKSLLFPCPSYINR